jgi:hypothetical protein
MFHPVMNYNDRHPLSVCLVAMMLYITQRPKNVYLLHVTPTIDMREDASHFREVDPSIGFFPQPQRLERSTIIHIFRLGDNNAITMLQSSPKPIILDFSEMMRLGI